MDWCFCTQSLKRYEILGSPFVAPPSSRLAAGRTLPPTSHLINAHSSVHIVPRVSRWQFTTRVNLSPWIVKYIFPDGHLPSLAQVFTAAEKSLVPEDVHQFGPDYAKTLNAWRNDWCAREFQAPDQWAMAGWVGGAGPTPVTVAGGKDPSTLTEEECQFRRMWWLYLTMCQALFEVRHCNLTQFVFSKHGFSN